MRQNHYYPYGLKHSNYNAIEYAYKENELGTYVVLDPTQRSDYRYKYNGMEFQDELGLNLYDMDFRDYDPAIARWIGIDPVTHHNMSPYMAFDGNPVFWADPSGADSTDGNTLDIFGRDRFDSNGMFIPFGDRGVGSFDEYLSQEGEESEGGSGGNELIDQYFIYQLILFANARFGGIISKLSPEEKYDVFLTDAEKTTAVLLYEFATGSGKMERDFEYGVHPFATDIVNQVIGGIVADFSKLLAKDGFKEIPYNTTAKDISIPFSPSVLSPSTWGTSIAKHLTSNKSAFFMGGALADVRINNGRLEGIITNRTSRNSLMLHIGENYKRQHGVITPLSNIYQKIHFSFQIQY